MTAERGGGPAPATELPELLAEHLASSARARPPAPPQVWAAVRPGERAIAWRAGEGPYAAETPGPHTMFEIGSNTKTFTALLLADMVVRGEINYTDPIAAFLPGHARPQRNRRRAASAQITLLHLATHTGGLPRLPRNLLARALRDRRTNPYARYTLPDLYAATARLGGGPPPGTRMRYSNYGVGLLGQLLANAAGTDYGTLITQRICRPLGLAETLPHPPPASDGSSGCWTIRAPKPRAYDKASRIIRDEAMAFEPSVNATAPASCSKPSSASSSPRQPRVRAP